MKMPSLETENSATIRPLGDGVSATGPDEVQHDERENDPDHKPSREGFTVVEMLVAVVILAIGVMGLVGTSAVVLRQMTGAKVQTNAAQLAASRIELLSGNKCAAVAFTGKAVTGAVTETWTVAPAANSTMAATVAVAFVGRTNPEEFKTVVSCF